MPVIASRPARVIAGLMISLVGAISVACSGSGDEHAPAAATPHPIFVGMPATTAPLQMADIKYSTTSLAVKAGEVIEVSLENKGSIEHDFSISKLPGEKAFRAKGKEQSVSTKSHEVHAHFNPGESGTVRLRVAEPGTYEFFCSVAGHKEAGMKGTLTVQ